MTLFVDGVDRNPFLSSDALWLHFLTPGGDMDKPDEAPSPASSVGERRWQEAREGLYGVGRDRMRDDATLHVALATLDTSDAQLKALNTGCEALAKAMEHFAEGAAALFAAEASWIDVCAHDERFSSVEDDPAAPKVREPASLPSGLVPAGVAAAATGLSEHKEAVGRLPVEITAMAREATDFQLAQARDFRALAKTYKKMDADALSALKSNAEDRSALQQREKDLRAYGGALVSRARVRLPTMSFARKKATRVRPRRSPSRCPSSPRSASSASSRSRASSRPRSSPTPGPTRPSRPPSSPRKTPRPRPP